MTRPNQVWAMDISYIPMARGFVYYYLQITAKAAHPLPTNPGRLPSIILDAKFQIMALAGWRVTAIDGVTGVPPMSERVGATVGCRRYGA